MAVYLDDFYKANERNLEFFVKIDIFSETISSGRTHFATLFDPVSKINSRSWVDQFSNMMGYLGEFSRIYVGSL